MMPIQWVINVLLWLVDHDPVPDGFVSWANQAMINTIRLYKAVGSGRSGRTCLFSRSCSTRALDAFTTLGWRDGLVQTGRQLRRCGGAFVMLTSAQGDIIMVASDGERFSAEELSAVLVKERRATHLGTHHHVS